VISYECLSHAHSICALLLGTWCLEMKYNYKSQMSNLCSDIVYASLTNSFLLPCGLNNCTCFASSRLVCMNELNCSSKHSAKSFSFTDYKIITKMFIPPETLVQLKWLIL
jgi:hypothetical protein